MKHFFSGLIGLLVISLSAAAQEQPEQVKHVTVCFGSTWATAQQEFKPLHEPGAFEPYSFEQRSSIQLLQRRIDFAHTVPNPNLGLHRTPLVSEDEIRPHSPTRWLMHCQVADLYPDGRIAIH